MNIHLTYFAVRPRGLDTHLQFKFAWATHHGRVESAKYDVSDVSVPVHGDVKVSPAVPSNPFDVICGTWERQVYHSLKV